MLYTIPDYYHEFSCVAGKCEDTCCAGWQIVADDASLENYKNELKKEKSEQNQENILAKMYNEVQEDVTQEVISKIDKLYINKNVNKIRIEVGVVWPYGNHNYTKPGEKIVGSKIAYIKTFNFTRENYSEVLKQYRQND